MIFGAILTTLGEQGKPVINFFIGANETILKFVQLLMLIAPLGIACLIAGKLGTAGGIEKFGLEFKKIGYYAITVIVGLLIHAIVILPLILRFFAKRNILSYAKGMSTALLTALSTASSSATLPVTIKCAEDNNRVSPRAAGFVLPLGATINMDGTALYEAVAAIFIAQLYGIDLGIGASVCNILNGYSGRYRCSRYTGSRSRYNGYCTGSGRFTNRRDFNDIND